MAFATAAALPFVDDSFNLVVCTEVLKHMPGEVLTNAVRELGRVSRMFPGYVAATNYLGSTIHGYAPDWL